jgi:hypothetical protein
MLLFGHTRLRVRWIQCQQFAGKLQNLYLEENQIGFRKLRDNVIGTPVSALDPHTGDPKPRHLPPPSDSAPPAAPNYYAIFSLPSLYN